MTFPEFQVRRDEPIPFPTKHESDWQHKMKRNDQDPMKFQVVSTTTLVRLEGGCIDYHYGSHTPPVGVLKLCEMERTGTVSQRQTTFRKIR